jgi:hypothetical protein
MPKRLDIQSIAIVGPVRAFDCSGTQVVRRPKGLSASYQSTQNLAHSALRPGSRKREPLLRYRYRARSPVCPVLLGEPSSGHAFLPILNRKKVSDLRNGRGSRRAKPQEFAASPISGASHNHIVTRPRRQLADRAQFRSFRSNPKLRTQLIPCWFRLADWYLQGSQIKLSETLRFGVENAFASAICYPDQMGNKVPTGHRPDARGALILRAGVSLFEQCSEFGLERATIGGSCQPRIGFDRIVYIPDCHRSHHLNPMIAMQSLYAMIAK